MRIIRTTLGVLAVAALALLAWACDGGGKLNAKLTPETRLSNVPPDGITSENPRLTLSWIGDDADGFVVAYKYRWNFRLTAADTFQYKPWTTILNISINNFALVILGDESVAPKVYHYFSTLPPEGLDAVTVASLAQGDTIVIEGVRLFASNPDTRDGIDVRYPVHVNPNSGTFIFDSQDLLNPHTYEIASIDNDGLIDPTPATLNFNTPQVDAPATEIIAAPIDTVLVLDYKTDTFEGVQFQFQGIDKNSRTLDYQWVVDKEIWLERTGSIPWSEFSPATSAFVTAADFPDKYGDTHTFYVRARNEFGSIDTLGFFTQTVNEATGGTRVDTVYARARFNTVYPFFKRPGYTPRTLLINNAFDFDTLAIDPSRPNSQMLEDYYRGIYSELGMTEGTDYDIWRVNANTGFPGRGMMGNYNKVHFIGDVVNFENFKWSRPTGTERALVPGRQTILIDYCNIGGKLLFNGWNTTRTDQISANDNFLRNILHMSNMIGPFGPGVDQFQYVGSKGQPGTGYPDAPLDQAKVDTAFHGALNWQWAYQLSGFGEIIYRFDSKTNLPYMENQPIGIRYLGITYDVFFISFPLYYTERAAAKEIIRKVNQEFDSPR
jgi:hypothetical protein